MNNYFGSRLKPKYKQAMNEHIRISFKQGFCTIKSNDQKMTLANKHLEDKDSALVGVLRKHLNNRHRQTITPHCPATGRGA